MLEQVVSFSIERSPEIEQRYLKEGKTFEGFLRQAVRDVYDKLEKPFQKEYVSMECAQAPVSYLEDGGQLLVASIKYNTQDAQTGDFQLGIPILGDKKDKVSYSLQINVSEGSMLDKSSAGNWPGTIYLGIDAEHSDFGQYKRVDRDKEFLNLPVLPLAEKVAAYLLHQEIPFALRFFEDVDNMMTKLTTIYKPRKE